MKEQALKAKRTQSPLRRLRFEAGDPTLSEVSEASGRYGKPVDRSLISRLEKGERTMSYEHAASLAPVYGQAPGDLLKGMAEWYEVRRAPRKARRASPAPVQAEVTRA